MNQDYMIAGFRLRAEGALMVEAISPLQGFEVFAVPYDNKVAPDVCLTVTDGEAPDFDRVLYKSVVDDVTSRFGHYSDGYNFCSAYSSGSSLKMWTERGSNLFRLTGSLDSRLLRFACWIAFGLGIASRGAVAVHTSVIVYRGKAVLFLGESGTGKSTHTRLWRENIGGATLLNDDSPIVRIHNDGMPYVYGSPWSGKTPCYKTECYPLAACVRLSQAPCNKIERLNVARAYAALHPSCPPDFAYDERLYDSISRVIGSLISRVPVYHLSCLPDAEAAYLSCKTIFGSCEG